MAATAVVVLVVGVLVKVEWLGVRSIMLVCEGL